MNRFQFIADHHRRYGVKRLCTTLGIALPSIHYWRSTAADPGHRASPRRRARHPDPRHHRESAGTYGLPRTTAELDETGEHVNHKPIARDAEHRPGEG